MANRVRITLAGEGESAEQALASVERRMGRVQRETRQTQGKMQGLNRVTSKTVSRMNGLAGAAGLAAGATGLGYLVKQSIDAADKIAKKADAIGVSTDALQEYRYIAERSGVATNKLDKIFQKFASRFSDLATGTGPLINRLEGVNDETLQMIQNAGSTSQALRIVFDRMKQMEDQTDRMRLATAAFGRENAAVATNMVNNIDELRQRYKELGLEIEEELLRGAEDAKDAIDDVSAVISRSFTKAVLELAPELENTASNMADWVSHNETFITQDVPSQISDIASGVKNFASAVAQIPEPVLYGGLGAVMGSRFGPYGALAGAGVGVAGTAAAQGARGEQPSTGMVSGATRRRAREEADKATQNTKQNLQDLGPLWEEHRQQLDKNAAAMATLNGQMVEVNEHSEGGLDKAQKRIRIFENEAISTEALAKRYRELYLWMDDMTKLDLQRSQMTPPSAVGPGGAGVDDEWAKEVARQREATQEMAPPQVRFSTLEGGADDEWARKQMESMDRVGEEAKSTANMMENAFDGWANSVTTSLEDKFLPSETTLQQLVDSFEEIVQ